MSPYRRLVLAFLCLVVTPASALALDAKSFNRFISKYACAAGLNTAEIAACKPKTLCRFPTDAGFDPGHLGFLTVSASGLATCVIPAFDSEGKVNGVYSSTEFELQ